VVGDEGTTGQREERLGCVQREGAEAGALLGAADEDNGLQHGVRAAVEVTNADKTIRGQIRREISVSVYVAN